MSADVRIHMKSVQKAGEETDVSQTDAAGRLTVSADQRFILRFSTSDEYGTTSTTIKSDDSGRVTVTRRGSSQTKMEFDVNTPTPFIYHTPMGTLEFMLKTCEISAVTGSEPSLSLTLRYTIYNTGAPVSENSIELTAV
ncbi:MAG: DUF1934 domain-containing protein [Candidatus Weimeria sp.]